MIFYLAVIVVALVILDAYLSILQTRLRTEIRRELGDLVRAREDIVRMSEERAKIHRRMRAEWRHEIRDVMRAHEARTFDRRLCTNCGLGPVACNCYGVVEGMLRADIEKKTGRPVDFGGLDT